MNCVRFRTLSVRAKMRKKQFSALVLVLGIFPASGQWHPAFKPGSPFGSAVCGSSIFCIKIQKLFSSEKNYEPNSCLRLTIDGEKTQEKYKIIAVTSEHYTVQLVSSESNTPLTDVDRADVENEKLFVLDECQ